MSYDVVLSRSGNNLSSIFGTTTSVGQNIPEIHEPQTIETSDGDPVTPADAAGADDSPINSVCTSGMHIPSTTNRCSPKKSDVGTPSRSRTTPSRFISAFTQFYSGDTADDSTTTTGNTIGGCTNKPVQLTQEQQQRSAAEESFPGRMESKLMSMWHNVKYGLSWSGKMRSSFSKEQPVWLLGRCYHRKYSLPSSMESSAELTANLENKLSIGIDPQQHHQLHLQLQQQQQQQQLEELSDPTVQEFGTDAIEGENHWEEGIDGFKRDFYSRLWMTYRREFPIMNGSNYTSDCGWGCMLRSGQMLLAQAMVCHFLGRNWRWDPETQIFSTHEDNVHRKIIRWFGDNSSKNSPFSIHTMVTLGQETGKKPGDWYGPSSVAHLIRQAVKLASQENADFDDIHVYVAQDCTVYIQDILDECLVPDPPVGPIAPWHQRNKTTEKSNDIKTKMHWKALILLVPLRLGTEKLNPIYGNSLKTLLSTEYCIGIIGGRPKHSLYFVGFQEEKLIHLDPHYCQEMVDVNQENFSVNSFHCKSPRKLKLSKLDPCCCIGFYCQTKADFDNFVASVQPYLLPTKPQSSTDRSGSPNLTLDINYPMFVFSRSRSSDQQSEEISESVYKPLQQQLRQMRQQGGYQYNNPDDDDDDETEEFVII